MEWGRGHIPLLAVRCASEILNSRKQELVRSGKSVLKCKSKLNVRKYYIPSVAELIPQIIQIEQIFPVAINCFDRSLKSSEISTRKEDKP